MNKSILMSIQPKWLVKILNGEKTIEIRKTMPKCDLPIDVYLYCTKNGKSLLRIPTNDKKECFLEVPYGWVVNKKIGFNGRVVAKFTLNKILGFNSALGNPRIYTKAKIGDTEVARYGKGKTLYAYHIDNLVIFDKPKELGEFKVVNPDVENVGSFGWAFSEDELPQYEPVKKAPQSWQYAYIKGE